MKSLRLDFTADEVLRLERAAKRSDAASLSELAKRAVIQFVEFHERVQHGHFPPERHPSAHHRPGRIR